MSEAVLQADLQRELLRLTTLFSTGDVVINDATVLDGGNDKAPYVNIENAETFNIGGIETQWNSSWSIPFSLIEKFTDWDATRNLLATHRATILNALVDTAKYLDASGYLSVMLQQIRGVGEEWYYDHYLAEGEEALPVFIGYRMIMVAGEVRRD
jgi:hypothetical protein